MNALLRALHAETLKLRHTLALWMVLLAPLAVALLLVLEMLMISTRHGATPPSPPPPAEAWMGFGRSVFALWTLMMLPLYVTLQAALLAQLEHGNHQWKHLQALPVPRGSHYLAKLLVLAGVTAAAYGVLLVLTPLAGWALGLLLHTSGLHGWPRLGPLLPAVLLSLLAAVLMVALQGWVALRWRSFTVAVSVGIVGTVAGFIVGQSQHYGKFFPWTMPVQAFAGQGQNATVAVALSLGAGLVVLALGLADLLRRDCP